MTPKPLKPGQKRVYAARVKDAEGNHPAHGDDWFRVRTHSNPDGRWGTRRSATDALERAKRSYPHGRLIGHVIDEVVDTEPTLETIKVDEWLKGDVVRIADVSERYRAQYRDTLKRAALAAYRYGSPIWINESFRSYAQQEQRYEAFLHGGPLAARPGTSMHEFGRALDIPNAREISRLIHELRRVQLIDDVPSEKWHVTNHHVVA